MPDSETVLGLSPQERADRGISNAEVAAALRDVVASATGDAKVITDATIPDIDFDHATIEGADRHPLVFRRCTLGTLNLREATIDLPIRIEDSTLAGLHLEGARVAADVEITDSRITGVVDTHEAQFERDVDFTGTIFETGLTMSETTFGDDTRLVDVTVAGDASFTGAVFSGRSNELGDNAAFTGATVEGDAEFHQATFGFATFEEMDVEGRAGFQEVVFEGDADFSGASFRGEADFDEADFIQDASFETAVFDGRAQFRGAEFEGGARTLEADATFARATFRAETNFQRARFRYVTFAEAQFEARLHIEEAEFDADLEADGAVFGGEVDFDEARFYGDVDFSGARFAGPAVFRGAAFEGEARHLERNAVFDRAQFEDTADFDAATFTAASFEETAFEEAIDLSSAVFEAVDLAFTPGARDPYVDLTDASIQTGTITQLTDGWVGYDLTRASIGSVRITAVGAEREPELLDHFRFCNTEFDEFDGQEFDFSAHAGALSRSGWDIHSFDDPVDREYALPMTSETIETTYLKAKKAASAGGYVKAAGEFRVRRQRAARGKYIGIAADRSEKFRTRLTNATRAVENAFLDLTCGYGMRLGRILLVFLVTPLVPALLFTFGGPRFLTGAGQVTSLGALTTVAGQTVLFENVYFSYITFLTIGYGGIGPIGALARLLAATEVYVSVVLGGLVLYALIKRSEL